MKLLFDQNISPRVADILSEDFPDSKHVVDLQMDQVADLDLWNYAKENGFCIVSKDADFGDWAQIFGYPPALVWLRMGNCSTRDLITQLKSRAENIRKLGQEGHPWVLVIL